VFMIMLLMFIVRIGAACIGGKFALLYAI
jgi:hypothetical protein